MRDGGFAVVLFYKKRNNMEDSYQQQGLYSRENEHDACVEFLRKIASTTPLGPLPE